MAERVSDLNPRLPGELFRFPPPSASESSEIRRSLMVGGGLDVRMWRGLAVGLDVRLLRLIANSQNRQAVDTAQVAMRVRYGF